MAKIQLSESNGNFRKTGGDKVLLKIVKCTYDADFGKVEMDLKDEKGELLNNNFGLMAQDGSISDGALKAFSYFSRVAMGDWGRDDIEAEDLVGKFVRADIKMTESKKPNKDGEYLSFANIDKCYMTDDRYEEAAKATSKPTVNGSGKVSTKAAKAAPTPAEDDDDDGDWE